MMHAYDLDFDLNEEIGFPKDNPSFTLLNERSVNIYSNMGDIVREGDAITITGELIGFDGLDVSLQWQYDDGLCWTDVPGADALTHTFAATAETVEYSWRLSVTVLE